MTYELFGVLGLAASIAALWYCMPRNGRVMPLVDTMFEPYVAIAISLGLVTSIASIAAGLMF
jgi:hypothetical protein